MREALESRLVETPAPVELDPLGRPLIGPCMVWIGQVDRLGYGRITNIGAFGDRKPRLVHRVSYALARNIDTLRLVEIPHVDHLCRVPSCCAPPHLEAVGQAENNRRAHLAHTVCRNGHERTPLNTSEKSGYWVCLDCKRDRYAEKLGRPLKVSGRLRRGYEFRQPSEVAS